MRVLMIFCAVFWVSACSIYSSSSTTYYNDKEGRLPATIFDDITPQATTATWLKQQFGTPLLVDTAEHNVQINTWEFAKERFKRRDFIILFRTHSSDVEVEYLHVVLQNNVVVQSWKDKHLNVDVERVIYALGLEKAPLSEAPPKVEPASDAVAERSAEVKAAASQEADMAQPNITEKAPLYHL